MRFFSVLSFCAAVLFGAAPLSADEGRSVRGTVVDATGQAVAGARVTVSSSLATQIERVTDRKGRFAFHGVGPSASIRVTFPGFETVRVNLDTTQSEIRVVLRPAPLGEQITVFAPLPGTTRSTTATKTDTPLRDVPQSVTVIEREVIQQQTMRGMADLVRYVPGVGMAQGEGNRDTPILRGNSSTSDFFVDGIRDDLQYFRDLYNVERVEALKGPNAMIFGRGGVGGVLNRVTRQADWSPTHELTLQGGSWGDARVEGDFGTTLGESAAARVTGVYQNSDSYRNDVTYDRYGINPTFAFLLGANTILRGGYEYFQDERTADRGITSFAGRPVITEASTFFGNADLSTSDATVHTMSSSLEHRFSDRLTLRSRIGYADYDKFYQNVFPGSADATGDNVSITAYNNATQRQNLFSQTDLILKRQTGRVTHTILGGVELGRQATDNFRKTGYFTSLGSNVTAVMVPLSNPTTTLPLTFRQSATDADNHGVAKIAAIYAQDQIALSSRAQVIAGLRYDRFNVEFTDLRTETEFASSDGLLSPRLGVVYKPAEPVSIYASYSLSYLPRAGEQLSSLNLSNQSLAPEKFRNYEIGAKWDVARSLEFTASVYRLDRDKVAVPDPVNPAVTHLVNGQRSEGVELSLAGAFTSVWSVIVAYAYQDGEILQSLSLSAPAGARLAQLPAHSISLWNKVDFSSAWGAGLGVVHRGEIFTSTDNTVVLPGFTRVDGALYYTLSQRVRAQLNVENLLDVDYYAYAHSNTNITPGSPRALRLSWTTRF